MKSQLILRILFLYPNPIAASDSEAGMDGRSNAKNAKFARRKEQTNLLHSPAIRENICNQK